MNHQPVTTLKQLIQRYGEELAADPRRTEALLNDYCPAYRTEVFVLVNAQRQQVPADLLATPKWMPSDAAAARLSLRLQDRLALSADAADWAVRSWAVALGLQRNPTAMSRLLDRVRVVFTPIPRTASDSGQSQPIGVESSTKEGAAGGSNIPDTSPQHIPFAEPLQRPVPAETTNVRGHLALAATVTTFAALWLLTMGLTTWVGSLAWPDTLARFTGPQDRATVVAALYPLPQTARVSAGPLNVRTGPDMTASSVTMLPAGQRVQVTDYSDDVQWSYIAAPAEGWVSNWYLDFMAGDETTVVRLEFRHASAAEDGASVHALPDTGSSMVARLRARESIATAAVTQDGLWRQTAQPVVGWVQANQLVPGEDENTRFSRLLPERLSVSELKRLLDARRTRE